MTESRSKPDQYQLRLPPGLRDRIKAYADSHGRSMNAEIVRVLEREFPEPWDLRSRIHETMGLLAILKEAAPDQMVDALSDELFETLQGIVSGRVSGMDESVKEMVRESLDQWKIERAKDYEVRNTHDLDVEEQQALYKTGRTEKY